MSDPDLAGADLGDGRGEFVPVGMIGDDQRQLDAACWRARARTRIQPEAKAGSGSGKRRVQRSSMADGGQMTMAPAKSLPLALLDVAGAMRPSAMPRLS